MAIKTPTRTPAPRTRSTPRTREAREARETRGAKARVGGDARVRREKREARETRETRSEPAAPRSPRARLVSIVEELRSMEAQLDALLRAARAELERAAAVGAVAAGGFGAVEELLHCQLADGSALAVLAAEAWPACAPAGAFAGYAALLDALEAREVDAIRLVRRARARLGTLERGGYRTGYRSYEELLERLLVGFPRLSTALLLLDQAELRARQAPLTPRTPLTPGAPPRSERSSSDAPAPSAPRVAWVSLRKRAFGVVAVASLIALVASGVAVRARAAIKAEPPASSVDAPSR